MPKYTLIEQVRLLKAFCQNTGYISGQDRANFSLFGSGKSFSSPFGGVTLARTVYGCRLSVYAVSILGSYIFNSYARPYVSSISISLSMSMSMSIRRSILFSALFLSLCLALFLSLCLSAVSHQLRQLSLASIPLRFICLLTVLWLITGSTMEVPP